MYTHIYRSCSNGKTHIPSTPSTLPTLLPISHIIKISPPQMPWDKDTIKSKPLPPFAEWKEKGKVKIHQAAVLETTKRDFKSGCKARWIHSAVVLGNDMLSRLDRVENTCIRYTVYGIWRGKANEGCVVEDGRFSLRYLLGGFFFHVDVAGKKKHVM